MTATSNFSLSLPASWGNRLNSPSRLTWLETQRLDFNDEPQFMNSECVTAMRES